MFDFATAWDSVLKCDDAIQGLQAEIRDRTLELANTQTTPPGVFPFDEWYAFVKAWNAYKAQVDRSKGAFFNYATTLDRVAEYWKKNEVWRKKAEDTLGLAPLQVPYMPPATPPPPGDPSRKLPYEDVMYLGLGVAGLYFLAQIFKR